MSRPEDTPLNIELQSPFPMPEPQTPEWYNLSGLERALNINDSRFHEYMVAPSTSRWSIDRFSDLGSELATRKHPAIQVAAGWAFAEAAMFKPRPKNEGEESYRSEHTAEDRRYALENALKVWRTAEKGLGIAAQGVLKLDPQLAGVFVSLQLRTRLALACSPIMRIVTEQRFGEPPSADRVARSIRVAGEGVVAIGARLFKVWNSDHREVRITRYGMAAETLACLALQKYQADGRHPFVVIPASLRQDHNDDYRLRSDIVALDTDKYAKKLIQVTSEDLEMSRKSARTMIVRRRELLAPRRSLRYTLSLVLQQEKGAEIGTENQAALDNITRRLGSRLIAFEPSNR